MFLWWSTKCNLFRFEILIVVLIELFSIYSGCSLHIHCIFKINLFKNFLHHHLRQIKPSMDVVGLFPLSEFFFLARWTPKLKFLKMTQISVYMWLDQIMSCCFMRYHSLTTDIRKMSLWKICNLYIKYSIAFVCNSYFNITWYNFLCIILSSILDVNTMFV